MKTWRFTKHLPWFHAQWIISASQVALGVTERKAANLALETVYTIPEGMEILELRFRATGSPTVDGRTGTAHIMLARKKDDISHAGDLALTVGKQIATENDANYVDTIVPSQKWITDIELSDASGNDGMAKCALDVIGYDQMALRIEYSGNTVWYCDLSGFSK